MRWMNRHLGGVGERLDSGIESTTLDATTRFYKLAKVLYAPNPELCALLERKTTRPCHLMQRGVETDVFTPSKRTRGNDGKIVLGFVGRLSVEKNVALLPKIDRELRGMGLNPEWLIVGHGGDEEELRRDFAESGGAPVFAGVLRGEALAEAYANMDLLVFPSHTDTFGNVVLEALASGVPAIVSPDGGPAHIVRAGAELGEITGCIATDAEFAASVARTLADRAAFARMRLAARQYALRCSWDAVFERVYAAYPASR
jgi:glycosyltransferase involved in cell wall biosynthesis